MAHIKDLHMAKNIQDLEKFSVIPDCKSKKMHILLETSKKTYHQAERHYMDGDEEMAYILYMKYLQLLQYIHNKTDYEMYKQAVRQTLGGNKLNKLIMDRVENLSRSLSGRYDKLNDYKIKRKEKKSTDVNTNKSMTKLQYPPQTPNSVNENLNEISCKELFDLIQGNSVLIMDCRSKDDYNISHLTYQWAFNVPENLITSGVSAGKLQDNLDSDAKVLWSARSIKDFVVLMHWNTPNSSNHTCMILLDILEKWDPDVTYRSPISILSGGYECFILMYPTLCTNALVQAPNSEQNQMDSIDDIEYPSIHDITMKDEIRDRGYDISGLNNLNIVKSQNNLPKIDRSSKQTAIKIYKQKAITDIMRAHEELLQKAENNDEQLKEMKQRLENLYEEKSSNTQNETVVKEEQQLLFNLMQLDSEAEDDKIQTNLLLEELKNYKKVIAEQEGQISLNEKNKLDEIVNKIEMKLHERQRLNYQREFERQQREKQLAAARENKSQQNLSQEKEVKLQMKPQIDRTIKPTLNTKKTIDSRMRDFSPVIGGVGNGLTGLKNLGNTCYMNSIIQCLSNTIHLKEFCLNNRYNDFINYNSKTKGVIFEEFAALIRILWSGNYKSVACKDLREVIGEHKEIFRGIEEQDSHEFLTILIDMLHSDLQTLNIKEYPRENITASERSWHEFTKGKESFILNIFYGQIKSTVKCVVCNKESATYECFSNLSLEIPTTQNFCLLQQCMDMYFSGEEIHGWNCPSCKQKRDAIKKLDISKLPPVLVIHLKRFYANSDVGNLYKKKQNYVRFPLEDMDMTPHLSKSESRSASSKIYDLYAVSNHYGSMESGHYTAFSKNNNFNRWFKFDDQIVTTLETNHVVSSAAYILFYIKNESLQINNGN